MGQRLHANELLQGILDAFETALKTPLNLKGTYRGTLQWLPPNAISSMVNGIWAELVENTDIKNVAFPKEIQVTYRVRCVFVRQLDVSNNIAAQRVIDGEKMIEAIFDNYLLSAVTLNGGQILWWLPRQIEWYPPEDEFVQALSADLTAIACNTEIEVRANFR
jgi:hypothetical protein